jgi:hypothetical protein
MKGERFAKRGTDAAGRPDHDSAFYLNSHR